MLKALLILTILPMFFISAYADPHLIETVIGSGDPGCEQTKVGCFTPNLITASIGHTITMSNTDSAVHTFTAGTPNDGLSNVFNTGLLFAGDSFEWIPDTAGEFTYFCMIHPWAVGTIIVHVLPDESHPVPEPVIEFPMILDELTMKGLDNNLMRLASDIERADKDIDEMMIYLEQATENNQFGKMQKYSERIGSLMAFVEICDTLVDVVYAQIQLHS